MPACDALQASLGVPIEYADCSWAGQNSGDSTGKGFLFRALDILRSPIKPDILFTAIGSPNDVSTTITQAQVDRMRYQRNLVVGEAAKQGVGLMLVNWMPSNYSVKAYGATDSLRTAYNAECNSAYINVRGVELVDLSSVISGAAHASGQIEMNAAYTQDGIHPNDLGNAALVPAAKAAIQNLLLGV